MLLSKFFHSIPISDDVFAVFNSLLMDIAFVNNDELSDIVNFTVHDTVTLQKLVHSGIYVTDRTKDDAALDALMRKCISTESKICIMYLIVSSACNFACNYCFVRSQTMQSEVMTSDTALIALQKYAEYLNENKIPNAEIIFYGGEPLLNFDVIETVVNKIEKQNFKIKCSIVTNGSLITEEKASFLANHQVDIGISLDGYKAVNDKNRIFRNGGIGTYDTVIDKIATLNNNNALYGLSITISEDVLQNQDQIILWLKDLGIKRIFYNMLHFTEKNDKWEKYYKAANAFIQKSYESLSPYGIIDGRLYRKIECLLKKEFKFADCAALGANQITVKPNGDICICHGYFNKIDRTIGNIATSNLSTLYNCEESLFWAKKPPLFCEECLSCEAFFVCGGGCCLQAEALFGSRDCIDRPFCIHSKDALLWILKKIHSIEIQSTVL